MPSHGRASVLQPEEGNAAAPPLPLVRGFIVQAEPCRTSPVHRKVLSGVYLPGGEDSSPVEEFLCE